MLSCDRNDLLNISPLTWNWQVSQLTIDRTTHSSGYTILTADFGLLTPFDTNYTLPCYGQAIVSEASVVSILGSCEYPESRPLGALNSRFNLTAYYLNTTESNHATLSIQEDFMCNSTVYNRP
jgi:hypothetical protein